MRDWVFIAHYTHSLTWDQYLEMSRTVRRAASDAVEFWMKRTGPELEG